MPTRHCALSQHAAASGRVPRRLHVVDDALIADSGDGLVALLGVILHELLAQLRSGGHFACFRLGCAGITTPTYLGQPVLREQTGLFDGQFPALAHDGLAAFVRYWSMNTLRPDG